MIKKLEGTKETVDFEDDSYLKCYDNVENEEYPAHWHTPLELIMPLENGYDIECSGLEYHLNERDILLIAPGCLHHIYAKKGRRIIFQAGVTFINNYKGFESFFAIIQPALLITPQTFPAIHEEAAVLMEEIMAEYFGTAPMKEAAISAKLLEILVMTSRSYTAGSSRFADIQPTEQPEYIEKFMMVCDYINAHCTEDLSRRRGEGRRVLQVPLQPPVQGIYQRHLLQVPEHPQNQQRGASFKRPPGHCDRGRRHVRL